MCAIASIHYCSFELQVLRLPLVLQLPQWYVSGRVLVQKDRHEHKRLVFTMAKR